MLLLPQAAHYTPLNKKFNGVDRTSISLGKHLTGQAKTAEMNKVKLNLKINTNELSTIYANTKKEDTRIKIHEIIVII